MSLKRIAVLAMAFLVACIAAAQTKTTKADATKSATADEKAPRLTLVEPVKEYGEVPKGDKLEWSFVVKNTGNADLQILAAKPGCGCTVADFDKVIKPGETVEFKPGSFHLMFLELKAPLAQGTMVKGTLTFEKAGTIEVEYKVEAIGGSPAGHHGH